MSKHTPGPWRVQRGKHTVAVVAADGTVICDDEEHYPTALYEGNARLIAAAPELLHALESLVAAELASAGEFGIEELEYAMLKARNAIANAATPGLMAGEG